MVMQFPKATTVTETLKIVIKNTPCEDEGGRSESKANRKKSVGV